MPYIQIPVIRKTDDDKVIFAITKNVKFRENPSQWDTWSSLLKSTALIKYAKWRSDGTSAPVCASNMMEDMKVEELVDKKNIGRFAKLMKLTDD